MQNLAVTRKLRAQAVVEFALVLPVLVLLIAGIVDLGNGYQTYIKLTNVAREGAHYGINKSTACALAPTVLSPNELPGPTVTCKAYYAVNTDGTCNTAVTARPTTPGGPICVAVKYMLNTLVGSVLGFGSFPIDTYATMIVFNP